MEVKKQQPRETPGMRPGPQGDRSSFSVPSPPRRSLNPSTQIVWVSITAGRYPQCLPNKVLGGGELGSGGSCEETLGRGQGGAQDTCGEKGTLLHCWWECKLVHPLWRTVWRFLKKLEIRVARGSASWLSPGWGRSPGEEHSNPLQDSCLGNPMDRGAR